MFVRQILLWSRRPTLKLSRQGAPTILNSLENHIGSSRRLAHLVSSSITVGHPFRRHFGLNPKCCWCGRPIVVLHYKPMAPHSFGQSQTRLVDPPVKS